MIIDSHCHLNYLKLNDKLTIDKVISKAKSAGVDKIISIAVIWHEIPVIKKLAEKFEDVFFSVGVHPSELNTYQPNVDDIIKLSNHPKCIAIGETGLDFYYSGIETRYKQITKFIDHMKAAHKVSKPIIIHTRSAKKDTLEILKSENVEHCGGVLHSFTGDYNMAKQAIDMGMYISFSGILTFKNAKDVQDVAKQLPLDRILIETDAPYLTPVPFRGKTNYPEYVKYIAEFLARLRSESLNLINDQIYKNTCDIFKLSKSL